MRLPLAASRASAPAQQKASSSGCGVKSRMVFPRRSSRRKAGRSCAESGYNKAATMNKARLVGFIGLVLSGLGPPAGGADGQLRAGVARINITPPLGHAMGGYAARKEKARDAHDPLEATVLVLESGMVSLALVTVDLRSFVSTRVGELAREKYGVQHTIISGSHTHSGPVTWEARARWDSEAEDKMVE